jgi:hypothetical protein
MFRLRTGEGGVAVPERAWKHIRDIRAQSEIEPGWASTSQQRWMDAVADEGRMRMAHRRVVQNGARATPRSLLMGSGDERAVRPERERLGAGSTASNRLAGEVVA